MYQYHSGPYFNSGRQQKTLEPYSPYYHTYFNCPYYRKYTDENDKTSAIANMTKLELSNTFRELWEQHGAWTRMTIMSIVFGLPDEEPVTNRLLRNPEDFGNFFKVFYGSEKGSKFSNLLKDYNAGVKVFDDIQKQSLGMADTMTEGVLSQFPENFIE